MTQSPRLLRSSVAAACAGLLAAAAPPPLPAELTAPVDPRVAALRDAALGDDVAWTLVRDLTTEIGPRPAGSAAEARARAWAVRRLTALGFRNVHIETYRMPVWQRGTETAEVVSPFPQPLTLTALGGSGATPAAGLTLPLVYFRDMAALLAAPMGSLKGKIAFVSNAMPVTQDGSGYGSAGIARRAGPAEAARRGAAAIVIRSIGTDHTRAPHTGQTNFPGDVAPIPAAALSVADAENLERMMAGGRAVTLHLTLTPRQIGERESGNVVAEVPGRDPSAGVVLIGGHLDSWDLGTGAIDDGAGVAITAAAAKRLLDRPAPRRTVRLVWFGAEEVGGLGGDAYAKAHRAERHAAAAESDEGADRIWRVQFGFPDSARAVADRVSAALLPLGIVRGAEPGHGGTDVGPTLALGVAGFDLGPSALRYFDWHHTPEDVLDRIDPEQLRQNVAAWTAAVAVIADAPEEIGAVPPRP